MLIDGHLVLPRPISEEPRFSVTCVYHEFSAISANFLTISAPIFAPKFVHVFEFLMELELKLEWLERVSDKSGGLGPPDFLTLAQAIPTSFPIPLKIQK